MPLKVKKRGDIWHYSGTVAGRRLRGSAKTTQKSEAEKFAGREMQLYTLDYKFEDGTWGCEIWACRLFVTRSP